MTYSALRIALVLASVGVLWLVGVRHWLLLVGFGVVIGAALSYLLLSRQRDAAVGYLQARSERRKAAGEDEEVEDHLTAASDEQTVPPDDEAPRDAMPDDAAPDDAAPDDAAGRVPPAS